MKLQKVSLNFQIDYTILKKVPQYLTIIKTKKGRLSDIKSLNLLIIFASVVRIHLDGDFYIRLRSRHRTSSLFTITSYFPKIQVNKSKVKSEEVIVKK